MSNHWMIKRFLLLVVVTCCVSACKEEQQTVNDFIKGSFAEIQQQYKGSPYLVVFWSQDCAFCMKELEHFGQTLKHHPNMKLVSVATDPFLDKDTIREKMASFGLQETEAWVFAEAYPETLYFDVDQRWRGELPLTLLFDSQNKKTKKIGMLKEHDFKLWLADHK